MIDFSRIGAWDLARLAIEQLSPEMDKATKKAGDKASLWMVGKIQEGIRNQAPGGKPFKKLHPGTIRLKNSSKALIDHGDLLNSVNYKWENNNKEIFIGVHRSNTNNVGIAEIHEFGTVIANKRKDPKKYRKVIKWLAANGFIDGNFKPKQGKAKNVIRIPKRPFIIPTFNKNKKEFFKIFKETINEHFGFIS